MDIGQALERLDKANDEHWTSDGAPRVDAVASLLGRSVSRKEITNAAPHFSRGAAHVHEEPAPEPSLEDADLDQVQAAVEPPPPPQPDPIPEVASSAHPSDDWDAGDIAIEDEVISMGVGDIFNDLELIDRAIAELNRQSLIAARRKSQAEAKVVDIGRRTAMCEKARIAFCRANNIRPNNQAAIKAYLERQREARTARAEKARKFIEAGTTAEDVRAQLSNRSKIDAAMGQRKAPRGSHRPTHRVAVGQG